MGTITGEPGPWGPKVGGGRRWRLLRRTIATLCVVALVGGAAVATTGALLVQQAETNLVRQSVPELEAPPPRSSAQFFLVVGSDSRDGLDASQRAQLTVGSFDGQRADTAIYVAISEDRETVSLVSLPRDLLVMHDGRQQKLTDTFAGGPDRLVRVLRENFGLPVNHYVNLSLGGFVDVVDTLGGVELCLEDALVDPKSGADFEPGCQQMDAIEALAFVRSRQGPRGDLERIERQQQFLRAMVSELTAARTLVDPRRLFSLVEELSTSVTTDEQLGVQQMISLADELRGVIQDGVPMTAVPVYSRRIDGLWYVLPYGPGARALFEDLREGRPITDRGLPEDRAETVVAIFSGGRGTGTQIVADTLAYAGFRAGGAGQGPTELDAGPTTTVYSLPGEEERAEWVAGTLGAPVRPLPASVTPPADALVVVAVGDDATS
jgi:LCP family protein required for cell wall assembly